LEVALGQYRGKQTGENALFRSLHETLEPEDVVLGDRYYGSYFDIALLKQRGVDSVFRLHQRRPCDFRRGRRVGEGDPIVNWVAAEPPGLDGGSDVCPNPGDDGDPPDADSRAAAGLPHPGVGPGHDAARS